MNAIKDTKIVTYNENVPRSNVQKTSKIYKNIYFRTLGGVDFSYVYIEAIKINIISPWFPL